MWGIFVIILTGLYASPYTTVTTERFDSKHSCESFVEESLKDFEVDRDGDSYIFTSESGDVITAFCGKIEE